MENLISFVFGALVLTMTIFSSIIYLAIKKYMETLAKLSAEDYYKIS